MNFHLSPYNHHQTEFITQPLISMSNPDDLNSIFKDPSDIKMEDLSKPKQTLQLKQSLCMITQVNSINHSTWAVPHYGTPCCSSAYPNDNPIISIILTEPLFLPWQWPQWPFPLGEDITVVGRGTQYIRVEARDHNHYWITCWVDNTGVEFTTPSWSMSSDRPWPSRCVIATCLSREFDTTLVVTSFQTHSSVLKDAILVTGKGDERERWAQSRDRWIE